MMGGLDWSGLPIVCELLGVEDIERLVVELNIIRDFQRRES